MADIVVDAADSFSPSLSSILNKLPSKRIDTYWREIAAAGVPEQAEQVGGYTDGYFHLSHLPLFPLCTDAQQDMMVRHWSKVSYGRDPAGCQVAKDQLANPSKYEMPLGANIGFKAMEIAGAGIGWSTIQWTSRTKNVLECQAAQMGVEQVQLAILTRWTGPKAQGPPFFVDVLEIHWPDPNSKRAKMAKVSGNMILIKAGMLNNTKISLKLLDTEIKGLKSQKMWSKKWHVDRLCEAVTFVQGSSELSMEIVARVFRACSVIETRDMEMRFEKHWTVPILEREHTSSSAL